MNDKEIIKQLKETIKKAFDTLCSDTPKDVQKARNILYRGYSGETYEKSIDESIAEWRKEIKILNHDTDIKVIKV